MKSLKYDLSLIIACYNEEGVLRENIVQIIDVLEQSGFSYEIIFVDDKSEDRTRDIINGLLSKYPDKNFKKIFHNQNIGRGGSVRDGIKDAQGETVGFIDIDLSTPASCIPPLVKEMKNGADIVTGERLYHISISSLPRCIISKGYNYLLKKFLKVKLKDTETGCKFFKRGKILPILDEVQDPHWFWDTEIMIRSLLHGLNIKEIPIPFIRRGFYSRVRILRDTIYYFRKLINLRRELISKGVLFSFKK